MEYFKRIFHRHETHSFSSPRCYCFVSFTQTLVCIHLHRFTRKKSSIHFFQSVDFPGSIFLNQHSLSPIEMVWILQLNLSLAMNHSMSLLLAIINLKRFPFTVHLSLSLCMHTSRIGDWSAVKTSGFGFGNGNESDREIANKEIFCKSKSCRIATRKGWRCLLAMWLSWNFTRQYLTWKGN